MVNKLLTHCSLSILCLAACAAPVPVPAWMRISPVIARAHDFTVDVEGMNLLTGQPTGHGSGAVIDCRPCTIDAPDSAGHVDGYRILVLTAGHCLDIPFLETLGGLARWRAPEPYDLGIVEYHVAGPRKIADIRVEPMHFGEEIWTVGFPLWLPMQVAHGFVGEPGVEENSPPVGRWVSIFGDPGCSGSAILDADGLIIAVLVWDHPSPRGASAPGRIGVMPMDGTARAWIESIKGLSYPYWLPIPKCGLSSSWAKTQPGE